VSGRPTAGAPRYEVRAQLSPAAKLPGWVPWDLRRNLPVEQTGRPGSHWSPSREATAAWVARENAAYANRMRQRSAGSTRSAVSIGRPVSL
jgi:hypothetical protein